MFDQRRIHRSFPIVACGAAVLLCATSGSGANKAKPAEASACMTAYTKAHERQQTGHLREARELFQSCAEPACGSYLQQECTTQVTQLDADIPSVVPVVSDGENAPRVDCEVKMDGEVLTSKLGGQALPVDPGVHEFTFSTDKGVFATEKLMIVQGQRNRPLSVSTRPPGASSAARGTYERSSIDVVVPESPAPASSPRRSPGVGPWIVGGAGLAGVGVGALLIYWGRTDNASLVSNCAGGGCSQAAVNHVSTMYVAGDVLAGAGLAALGVSAVWLLVGGPRANVEPLPPPQARFRFDVQPAHSGGLATVSGSF
jgi:hypothetical protein